MFDNRINKCNNPLAKITSISNTTKRFRNSSIMSIQFNANARYVIIERTFKTTISVNRIFSCEKFDHVCLLR